MTATGEAADATQKFDLAQLVNDLRKQVSVLEVDLRARSEEVEEFSTALRAEYNAAFGAKRTAATYDVWRDDRVTQVAAAWVLGTVFVRYCEDNGLIESPFFAGPGERLADAEERHEKFFREHPQLNDRDWLVEAFNHLAGTNPAVTGLFDKRHNPLWEITPSFETASALLTFWRRRDDDGEIRHDFTGSDTRFLGDLYQDLSEHARKTFALLQTPVFVEEFILDLTLEPAVEEFGLKGLRTIDPACGSGHFLLDIFNRLLSKWREDKSGPNNWDLIRRSLESVHGCDKNPFAVAIARFRLLVAVLQAAEVTRLEKAPEFPLNIAVGDSLMHGEGIKNEQGNIFTPTEAYIYRIEDVDDFIHSCDLLKASSYHVVVGNPPYITVKDKQENANYRERYNACSGTYAMSVPFAQRLFQLAIRKDGDERDAGFVGQITSNSFMKREFGRKLIEQFFPTTNLTHVINTSGAHIPGHNRQGTPTVVLIGRNHTNRPGQPIRAALAIRGEPSRPKDPSKGVVWSAIRTQINKPHGESEWISVTEIDRSNFFKFPWSLSGGGANTLIKQLESSKETLLSFITENGRTTHTGLDDAFFLPNSAATTRAIAQGCVPVILGENIRDFGVNISLLTLFPYDDKANVRHLDSNQSRFFWPNRTILRERVDFNEKPEARGLRWFDHSMFFPRRYRTFLSIAYAFKSSHNHFSLDRGGKVFKQTAPAIKLAPDASEKAHLSLLGLLNSSTACFWLRQNAQHQGGGSADQPWSWTYEFSSAIVGRLPIPSSYPTAASRTLDALAMQLSAAQSSMANEREIPTRDKLNDARDIHDRVQQQMVSMQEELDWQTYSCYGLLNDTEARLLIAFNIDTVPAVKLGERAFEIALARKPTASEAETAWFTRHGSEPITDIPGHWPEWYRQIVQARIDIIERRKDIALIERPECKRRWASVPWEKKEAEALRSWLLDCCETEDLWFSLRDGMKQPRTLTVSQLADQFRDDADMNSVAQLYAPTISASEI
jgi:hypothetical protein